MAVLFALLAGLGAPTSASAAAVPPPIDIRGNLVLVNEVYLAALDLPAGTKPTPATARRVERQLLDFLRRAGYTLATVKAWPAGDHIDVSVDEGRLSRIIVRGRDVVTSVAVKLQIDLPYDIFNRPQLERLLQGFRNEGARVSYRLVPARNRAHSGLQIDPLALLPGGAPLPRNGRYELHIDFAGVADRKRLSLVAGIDSDSIRAGGKWTQGSTLLAHDHLELEAQVGANFFEDLTRQASELHFSRVLAGGRWLVRPLPIKGLRFMLRLREDLLRRQRQDLRVQSYWWNRLEGSVGVSFIPRDEMELTLEVGGQQRDLFAIDQLMDTAEVPDTVDIPPVEQSSELRPFVGLAARLLFQPERLRLDRRERIEFEGSYFPGPALSSGPIWFADAEYRRVFEFGWNDLWLQGEVAGVAGSYGIADAIPMRFLRGVFGHQFYLDRAASFDVEYRLSLTRDLFKVGFFNQAAIYRETQHPGPAGPVGAGTSFGPSFHALVLDVFQVDFYYAFGFTLEGEFDYGVSFRLEKAF